MENRAARQRRSSSPNPTTPAANGSASPERRVKALDYGALAAEWLKALRGRRSQTAFSRRLGYKSNIAYRWESARAWPTAARTLSIVQHTGGNVAESLQRFYRRQPSWLSRVDPCSAQGVARLLDDLRGKTAVVHLAERTGYSRFSIARWLKGDAQPTLPEFLHLVEATSLRLLDFVAAFTDASTLPSIAEPWRRLVEARQLAYEAPWSHAVLRVLELEQYKALEKHQPGWIAKRLGLAREIEDESLELLERTGTIHFDGRHYRLGELEMVDTRADPAGARSLKAWWTAVARERLNQGRPGVFSYNLSAVSEADFKRLEELHRAYYREMSRIIAESEPSECVVLYSTQLLQLDH